MTPSVREEKGKVGGGAKVEGRKGRGKQAERRLSNEKKRDQERGKLRHIYHGIHTSEKNRKKK